MALRYALLAACLCGFGSAAQAAEKPNIVYFIIDELGYYEQSHMGHPEMRTPNIDRLAAEGVRFSQMLAGAPVCAPTRCALLTGKHAGHMTVRNNPGSDPLLEGEETIGSMLRSTRPDRPAPVPSGRAAAAAAFPIGRRCRSAPSAGC